MTTTPGSVVLSPSSQLGFERPLTQLVKRTLKVSNSNSQPVAFKVKTTAPKQYCVRPNSGRIEPGETVEVQVLLQPMKEDPAPGTKCRDKFLVQSVTITPERESISLPELWSAVEKEDKTSISEQKIRCAYLPPVGGNGGEESHSAGPSGATSPANGSASQISTVGADVDESKFTTIRSTPNGSTLPTASDTFSSSSTATSSTPPPEDSTSLRSAPAGSANATGPTSTLAEQAKDKVAAVAAPVVAAATGAAAAVGFSIPNSTTSSASTTTSTTKEPLLSAPSSGLELQLSQAQAEISRLRAALAEAETNVSGLRQRSKNAQTVGVSSGGSVPGTAQAVVEVKGQEGVPLQVVAGLVFGVFVVTWLFF